MLQTGVWRYGADEGCDGCTQGMREEVVAAPLYWYRTTDNSLARTPAQRVHNLQLHLRPYYDEDRASSHALGDLVGFTQRLHQRVQVGRDRTGLRVSPSPCAKGLTLRYDSGRETLARK